MQGTPDRRNGSVIMMSTSAKRSSATTSPTPGLQAQPLEGGANQGVLIEEASLVCESLSKG